MRTRLETRKTFFKLGLRHRGAALPGIISHKNTLFHTVAHFRVSKDSGQAVSDWQNRNFINEIKDLAHIVEAVSNKNISIN